MHSDNSLFPDPTPLSGEELAQVMLLYSLPLILTYISACVLFKRKHFCLIFSVTSMVAAVLVIIKFYEHYQSGDLMGVIDVAACQPAPCRALTEYNYFENTPILKLAFLAKPLLYVQLLISSPLTIFYMYKSKSNFARRYGIWIYLIIYLSPLSLLL